MPSAAEGIHAVTNEQEKRFYPPWGKTAANADALNALNEADRDPDLEEKLLTAGMRKYRVRGVVTYAPSNPYRHFLFAAVFVVLGFFVFWAGMPRGMPFDVALLFATTVWVLAVATATGAALTVRRWHRLRPIALDHVAATGGKLPHELNWFI
jgi:Flp pilus assembly protein TadB